LIPHERERCTSFADGGSDVPGGLTRKTENSVLGGVGALPMEDAVFKVMGMIVFVIIHARMINFS
jgi:hypothetical protein